MSVSADCLLLQSVIAFTINKYTPFAILLNYYTLLVCIISFVQFKNINPLRNKR